MNRRWRQSESIKQVDIEDNSGETICQHLEQTNYNDESSSSETKQKRAAPGGTDKAWPKAEAVVLSLEVVLKPAKIIVKETFPTTIMTCKDNRHGNLSSLL